MQNMSFHVQRWEIVGTQAIYLDHWSFYLYLSQCHLLYSLHSLQKVIYRRNRETARRPIPRAPSRRRELKTTKTHLNLSRYTLIDPIILSKIWQSADFPYFRKARTEGGKTPEQKIFFKSTLLILTASMNAFHSTNLFCCNCFSRYQAPTNSVALSFCI